MARKKKAKKKITSPVLELTAEEMIKKGKETGDEAMILKGEELLTKQNAS